MSLTEWLQKGWLVEHKSCRHEIRELLGIADRDLIECKTPGLGADWQLGIAYNAVLQLAITALAATGYRTRGEAHHYRVIQSLAYTIGAQADLIAQLDAFRKKRNISDYERTGTVSAQEAKEIFALAKTLREKVSGWLKKNHPELY